MNLKVKIFYNTIIFLFFTISNFSQVLIGSETISPTNPDASLELNSINRGLLINRIELTSTTSASPLSSHVLGMVIYNTATNADITPGMYYNNGTKWIRIESNFSGGSYGFNVKAFGAKGDNTTDDTLAFQKALDSAKVAGNRVIVPVGNYKITSTLKIEDGVMMVGEGTGSTPLQTPYNGSSIRYTGGGFALQILGHNAGLRDLLIYDANQGASNASGIQVLGDGEIIESLRFFNVLILYFVNGTGLELSALNSGGVTYGTYYNVRVRHAKTGIRITQDASSFTNSNVFHHGAISGGGFDYGLLIESGNNNQFYGTIIEPPSSNFGHLVVNAGEIQATNIRIEANSQNTTDPVIHFKSGTMNSNVDGTFAGGLVINDGNNRIGFRSGKSALYEDSGDNLYENSNFYGLNGTDLPYWDITGTGVTYETLTSDLFSNYNVLKITVPGGVTANLEPSFSTAPKISNHASYNQMTAGMFVKTSQPDNTYIRTNAPAGVTVSQSHPGDGNWHFISTANAVNTATDLDTKLEIANTSGGTQEVYITAPTFAFGYHSPKITPKPISSAGGILTGTLTKGVYHFTPTSTYIVLPKNEGNIFFIDGTQSIHRINHSSTNVFPKGTVITFIFEDAGLTIVNGAYINLKSSFTSTTNSSLQIVSMGNGTWIEMNRNL